MALIKCPECKHKISDTAISCPHCGFVLSGKILHENKHENKNNKTSSNKLKDGLLSFIRFEWIEDISDFLGDIPIIGWLLSWIFFLICVAVVVVGVPAIVYYSFIGLWAIHPILAIVVGLVGLNVLTYCASYVWGMRKPWFFWVCLILTIIALIIVLGLLL